MRHHINGQRLPKIAVSEPDYEALSLLAGANSEKLPEVAEELLFELERARIAPERQVTANVIRMGSTLIYCSDDGMERRVTLSYPGEADISVGRISIMTPIGTAPIGLPEGQSIAWTTRSGKRQTLTVLKVEAPTNEHPA